jgi:hypothetical protein
MSKTYLRKQQVAARYQTTPRNIDRMAADGRIPEPDFYNGRTPLWASDRAAAVRSRPNRAEHDSKTA